MEINITPSQKQKFKFAQKMQQGISILQYNQFELKLFLENSSMENPFLDIEYPNEKSENIMDYLNHLNQSDFSSNYNSNKEEKSDFFENIKSTESETLTEHLMLQLNNYNFSPSEKKIASYIIMSLDDNGYLEDSIYYMSNVFKTKSDIVENVLKAVQLFDPVGIAAKNLYDCICIQLEYLGYFDEKIKCIIHNYLKELSNKQFKKLCDAVNIDECDLIYLTELLKQVNPKPARFYSNSKTIYIFPEIEIKRINEDYEVNFISPNEPALRINQNYKKIFETMSKDSPEYAYMKKNIDSAMWIIKMQLQRKNTITSIVKSIFLFQNEFYDSAKIIPMSMKNIADAAGVHISTVSRTVNDKYVQTPHGVYELKSFFVKNISKDNSSLSAKDVKTKILDIIETESKSKPYSDDKILNILHAYDIYISRRAIAKYRNELGVPSSFDRKIKYKNETK